MERAKQLVNEHWDGYISKLIEVTIADRPDTMVVTKKELMDMLEFHYKSSGIHFYGHAVEDCNTEGSTMSIDTFLDRNPEYVERFLERGRK